MLGLQLARLRQWQRYSFSLAGHAQRFGQAFLVFVVSSKGCCLKVFTGHGTQLPFPLRVCSLATAKPKVFFTGNLKFSLDNNRNGTMRSAVFLITFTIVHALGNFVDMLGGPAELNGAGLGFPALP